MKLGIVIPTYNRETNLSLCLTALVLQEPVNEKLQVAVWDDGSTDRTKEIVSTFGGSLDIRYGWHQHAGYRVSLNRNRGTALLDRDTTHVWYIDSDVVLNKGAIKHGTELAEAAPHMVIIGKYVWLPPMQVQPIHLKARWDDMAAGRLPPQEGVSWHDNIVMRDPRNEAIWTCPEVHGRIGGLSLAGNLLVPMVWVRRTGGFDEAIEGQGQDCDFGKMLTLCGAECICCPHIIGYHLSHYRDQRFLQESVRQTIAYMRQKYSGTAAAIPEGDKDD